MEPSLIFLLLFLKDTHSHLYVLLLLSNSKIVIENLLYARHILCTLGKLMNKSKTSALIEFTFYLGKTDNEY